MIVLLDTDICLSLLFGTLAIHNLSTDPGDVIGVSIVTVEELFVTANLSRDPIMNKILIEKFLLTIRIIYPNLSVIKYMADVRSSLLSKGRRVNPSDLMVYSIAKIYKARLITTNGKRYSFT